MDQIYPDEGLVQILLNAVAGAGSNWKLILFTSPTTQSLSTSYGSLVEPTNTGYSGIVLTSADFTSSGVSSHLASILGAPKVFSCSAGSSTVYGYALVDLSISKIIDMAIFDSPQTFDSTHPVSVIPILGTQSLLSS